MIKSLKTLYGEQKVFKPHFKLGLVSNNIPHTNGSDGGVWRRIKVVDFNSRFVDNPTRPGEFLKDPLLEEKSQSWSMAFITILLEYYAIYKAEGRLVIPKEVDRATEKRKRSNDKFGEFIYDRIEEADPTCKIDISQLYTEFKYWFKDQNPSENVPSRKRLIEYCEINNYTFDEKSNWVGVKFTYANRNASNEENSGPGGGGVEGMI